MTMMTSSANSVIPAKATARPPTGEALCCWPIGEPSEIAPAICARMRGFRTCDAPAQPRRPYCAEHAGAAYVPMRSARDRPDGPALDRSLRRIGLMA